MTTLNEQIQEILDNPPVDGFFFKPLNIFVDGGGHMMSGVHSSKNCVGHPCPIHRPSEHSQRHLKLVYRYSDLGLEPIIAERICEHGVGCPDPDWLSFIEERHGTKARNTASIHGCCGKCPN